MCAAVTLERRFPSAISFIGVDLLSTLITQGVCTVHEILSIEGNVVIYICYSTCLLCAR